MRGESWPIIEARAGCAAAAAWLPPPGAPKPASEPKATGGIACAFEGKGIAPGHGCGCGCCCCGAAATESLCGCWAWAAVAAAIVVAAVAVVYGTAAVGGGAAAPALRCPPAAAAAAAAAVVNGSSAAGATGVGAGVGATGELQLTEANGGVEAGPKSGVCPPPPLLAPDARLLDAAGDTGTAAAAKPAPLPPAPPRTRGEVRSGWERAPKARGIMSR
mmetsp:Transcript_149178/g.379474  ORF Transcript_149178/g.379474 Transcript_149178/m.379474 type:complete len:218 (-) Transcript_149178:2-655(-)